MLVTSLDVRRYVRGLLVKNGLNVPVLSYQDLSADFPVQPIGAVGLNAAEEDGGVMAEQLESAA